VNRRPLCLIGIHNRTWKLHTDQSIPDYETYAHRCSVCGHIKEFVSVHTSRIGELDLVLTPSLARSCEAKHAAESSQEPISRPGGADTGMEPHRPSSSRQKGTQR